MIKGIFNQYEVINIWASAKDIITKRTLYWQQPIDEYQIILPKKDQITILKSFLRPSQQLQSKPKFYNTLTQNCTNLLAKYVNHIYPKKIPWDSSFILTGKSGKYLESLGYAKFVKTLHTKSNQ